jgi:hypothetical protein
MQTHARAHACTRTHTHTHTHARARAREHKRTHTVTPHNTFDTHTHTQHPTYTPNLATGRGALPVPVEQRVHSQPCGAVQARRAAHGLRAPAGACNTEPLVLFWGVPLVDGFIVALGFLNEDAARRPRRCRGRRAQPGGAGGVAPPRATARGAAADAGPRAVSRASEGGVPGAASALYAPLPLIPKCRNETGQCGQPLESGGAWAVAERAEDVPGEARPEGWPGRRGPRQRRGGAGEQAADAARRSAALPAVQRVASKRLGL